MHAHLKRSLPRSAHATIALLHALIAVCVSAVLGQPIRFSMSSSATGAAGEAVEIALNLDPAGHAVGSFDATLAFQNTLLTYMGFSAGPVLAARDSWLIDVQSDNARGTIVIGAFSLARVTGPGAAILLQFTVSQLAVGGDTTRLSLLGLAATDTNAAPLPAEGLAGFFTVKPMLSGRIRTPAGAPLSGVMLTGLPGEPVTDTMGYYRAALTPGWSGAVTPAKSGYAFDPPSRHLKEIWRDLPEQDFFSTAADHQTFAFPNPFNPEMETTQIRLVLPQPAGTSVKIIDGRGDLVREWTNAESAPANVEQLITWDGRNGRGELVAIGVYFYVIETQANGRMFGKIGVAR